MGLSEQEMKVASQVLKNIRAEKYKDWNYLFQERFDLNQVPGYLETIAPNKPMALQTIAQNLENDLYDNLADVWSDIKMTFENAQKYHGGKPTKWIAKMARDMIKFFQKERKSAEKNRIPAAAGPGNKSGLKIKLEKQLPTAANVAAAQAKVGSMGGDMASIGSSEIVAPPKSKKLKVKLNSSKSAEEVPSSSAVVKPKIRLKLKPSSSTMETTSEDASSVKSSSKSSKSGSNKISLKMGSNRGKELPKGVVQPATASSGGEMPSSMTGKVTSSKTGASSKSGQKRKRTSKKGKDSNSIGSVIGGLSDLYVQQCTKILLALKRRHQKDVPWFLSPVSDKSIIQDYRAKIKYPMDIGKMTAKLENHSYKSVADFCLDLRRIFSNCLCYNTGMKDSIRPVALNLLEKSENYMALFFSAVGYTSYPKLLYCWKTCMEVIGTLFNLVNPSDGQPTVLYFLYPVKVYCGGQFPADYLEKVSKPMDFQTVASNLLEGRYKAVEEFAVDLKLIVENCNRYYADRDDGRLYIEQANRLGGVMNQQLDQLMRYDRSNRANTERAKVGTVTIPIVRPPPQLLQGILSDLKNLKYTDKATRITEPAMAHFEKPVSLAVFPDYGDHVSEPMDLSTVESNVKAMKYDTPEDFEYDMNLIFRNCENYNSQRNGDHLISLAKFGLKNFRRIFYQKMKTVEDPTLASQSLGSSSPTLKEPAGPLSKKQKLDSSGPAQGKVAPRLTITISAAAAAAAPRGGSKSPKPPGQQKKNNDGPLPLHIAIARVKEGFHLRRPVKSLQPWEQDCARYFKELLRHPWLSATKPQFIFHVPVTMLFPDLRDAYAAKIRKPMDLTTVECTLLAGNRYASPEDLIDDVALTFANAVRFNKDGRDIGDTLSTAYFDASVHLLRYARWLSMELLLSHIDESSDHVDEPTADGLPPFSWRLTKGNRLKSQEEQNEIVLKEPLDRSLGGRLTWHETECEKLLKALRHQSDLKYMTFFIQPHYPADYTVYISKPMDWEKVQKTLKKRQYDNFGQIVDDLRLIFKNALKYNARFKGTENVSGRAYAAAEYMSKKLETAIRKMMLTVSDRTAREAIDHANAERQLDAEERAEEERIRAAWKKDPDNKDGSSPVPPSARGPDSARTSKLSQKIRMARKVVVRREEDFEIPYFDEDDGQHEQSFRDLVRRQKLQFEKQREEGAKMRKMAMGVGATVYLRLLQRNLADEWVQKEGKKLRITEASATPQGEVDSNAKAEDVRKDTTSQPSSILDKQDRGLVKMSLKALPKKKKGKTRRFSFG